jgi:hypothetical protein
MRKLLYAAIAAAALAGCAAVPEQITTMPAPGALPVQVTDPVAVQDLKSAASNLDQALAIGALPKDDPSPGCLHDALQRAGIELAPGASAPQSFKPANDGVFSLGTILYIQAQQLKAAAKGGITVSQPCLALIGQIHLDAMTAAAKFGSRLIPLPISLPGIR